MSCHNQIHLSDLPLLIPLGALASGIAGGVGLSGLWFWMIFSLVGLGVAVAVIRRRMAWSAYLVIGIVGLMLGKVSVPTVLDEAAPVSLKGEVEEVRDFGNAYRLVVSADGRNYLTWVNDFDREILEGDSVAMNGIAIPPKYVGSVPDEITNENFLILRRIYAEVEGTENFKIIEECHGLRAWPARSRRWLSRKLENCGLNQPSEQFLQAVLLGEMNLDYEIREDFSRSGLSHVLALSGTHVGIIAMVVAMLFFPFSLFGGSRVGMAISLALLWIYAVMTGCSPSVMRAVTMISFVMLGRLFGRNSNSFNTLCGAALLILLFSPLTLLNVGFQLSFLAVAGILTFMPMMISPVIGMKTPWRKVVVPLSSLFLLPIAAVLATAPLAIYRFHLFPMLFILSNLPVGVVLPVILIGGIILLIFSVSGVGIGWLANMLNWLIEQVLSVGNRVAELQPDSLSSLYPSALQIALGYLALFFMWLAWNNRRRIYLLSAGVVAIAIGLISVVKTTNYPATETYEWEAGYSYNLIHRTDSEVYIITDAPQKQHDALVQIAAFRLKDYLAKRNARLVGIADARTTIPDCYISDCQWNVGRRKFLIINDENLLTEEETLRAARDMDPEVIVVSRGFKGDARLIRQSFPNAGIILSPSLYAPLRREAMQQLSGQKK